MSILLVFIGFLITLLHFFYVGATSGITWNAFWEGLTKDIEIMAIMIIGFIVGVIFYGVLVGAIYKTLIK